MTDVATPAGVLQAAFRSDPGRVRSNNEDLALVDAARGIFGVIDGVGGSAAGEVAAAIAHEVILKRLARPLGTPAERVREAIAIANNEIFRRAEQAPGLRGMTCVITLALVADGRLTIGHVGDSRLYVVAAGGLRKLTRDHSPIGEREDAREIGELEAMRHPRRNELYRDVGGAWHDKDEEGFVDVIEVPWEGDEALLLCTDGLTDMVPSGAIERVVRRHAGEPQRVADALVEAANDAGGHDNVTVVYAEPAGLGRAVREGVQGSASAGSNRSAARGPMRRAWSHARAFTSWVVHSRTTWFALGALAGVLAALALVWRAGDATAPRSRTFSVGPVAPGASSQVAAALATARPGDVVRLEPGVYAERIVVPGGVTVEARLSGSVTLQRPPGVPGPWVAIAAEGTDGGRLAGVRIESTPQGPIDVGIRISGQGRTIEMVDVIGPAESALELLPASSVVLLGSVLEVPALAVRLDEGAHATLTNNILTRMGRARTAPISLGASSHVVLSRNVLAGFGPALVEGAGAGSITGLTDNFVVGAESRGAR